MLYFVEMTDTFGGEANYCWVNRFLVKAKTMRGAIQKVSREVGATTRKVMDCGDFQRFDAIGACVCFFVQESNGGSEAEDYARVKTL